MMIDLPPVDVQAVQEVCEPQKTTDNFVKVVANLGGKIVDTIPFEDLMEYFSSIGVVPNSEFSYAIVFSRESDNAFMVAYFSEQDCLVGFQGIKKRNYDDFKRWKEGT